MPLFRELWAEEVVTRSASSTGSSNSPSAAMRAWVAEAHGEVVGFGELAPALGASGEGIAGIWSGVLPPSAVAASGRASSRRPPNIVGTAPVGSNRPSGTTSGRTGLRPAARVRGRRSGTGSSRSARASASRAAGGSEVIRFAEVRERERELFELYDAAERDMPDDYTHAMAFEDWLRETLGTRARPRPERRRPRRRPPAAFAWLIADRRAARPTR